MGVMMSKVHGMGNASAEEEGPISDRQSLRKFL